MKACDDKTVPPMSLIYYFQVLNKEIAPERVRFSWALVVALSIGRQYILPRQGIKDNLDIHFINISGHCRIFST
jgi:hypothetical protein